MIANVVKCSVDCKSCAQCCSMQCGTEVCGGFIIGQDRRRFVGLGVASPGPPSHHKEERGGGVYKRRGKWDEEEGGFGNSSTASKTAKFARI